MELTLTTLRANTFEWWERYRFPIVLFLVVRAALSVWAAIVVGMLGLNIPPSEFAGRALVPSVVETYAVKPWQQWDTGWYLRIAGQGYRADDGSAAFMPLYPLLIRAASAGMGGAQLWAALLISNVAALAAFVLLFDYTRAHFGEPTARRTLVLWAAFPTAFFLFAGYTESLFMVWMLLAFTLADRGRWGWVGVCGGLAALTRLPGLALLAPLGCMFWTAWRGGKTELRKGLWGLALMLGIAALYWLYLAGTFRDLSVWGQSMAHWRVTGLPGQSIGMTIVNLFSDDPYGKINNLLDLTAALLFLSLVVWSFFDLPLPLAVCGAVLLLVPLTSIQMLVPQSPLTSMPRYGVILFPVMILLARRIKPRLRMPIVALEMAFQIMLVTLFLQNIWVA